MSTKLFRNWHSGNMALGQRALLYLMDDPSQATTLLGIARRLRIDPVGCRRRGWLCL